MKTVERSPVGAGVPEFSELTFLLQSGSNRIGALDFQQSASGYVPRLAAQASTTTKTNSSQNSPPATTPIAS
jgi:hypothetical protein